MMFMVVVVLLLHCVANVQSYGQSAGGSTITIQGSLFYEGYQTRNLGNKSCARIALLDGRVMDIAAKEMAIEVKMLSNSSNLIEGVPYKFEFPRPQGFAMYYLKAVVNVGWCDGGNTTKNVVNGDFMSSTYHPVNFTLTEDVYNINLDLVYRGDKVSMLCTETNMTATFDEMALQGAIMNITAHASCTNAPYYLEGTRMVSIPFSDCPNVTQSAQHMKQTMEVSVRVSRPINDVVHRIFVYQFTLQCQFDRHLKVSQSQIVNVSYQIKSFVLSSKTNFSASLLFYKTIAFSQVAQTPLHVTANEPIYLQIAATYENPLIKFVTQDCFATPTVSQHDPTRYLFFSDRCPMDSTFQEHGRSSGNKFSFSIAAFAFIKVKKTVFFHCKLLVCKNDTTTAECTQACSARAFRRRREIQIQESKGLDEVTVNSGAVVYKSKPSCKDTTCPLNSICLDITPAVCKCVEGFVLDFLTNQCENQNLVKILGIHLDQKFSDPFFDPHSKEFLHMARYFEKNIMVRLSNFSIITGIKIERADKVGVLDLILLYTNSSNPRKAFSHFLDSIFTPQGASVPGINAEVLPKLEDETVENEVLVYSGLIIGALLAVLVLIITILIIRNHRTGKFGNPSSKGLMNFKEDFNDDSAL